MYIYIVIIGYKTMKFGYLVDYNKIIFLKKKSCRK